MTPMIPKLLIGLSGASSMLSVLPELAMARGRTVGEYVCIMTPSAARLIHPALVGSILGTRAYTDTVDDTGHGAPHRVLLKGVDAALVAPATANTLGSLAHGLTGNLLTLTLANYSGPIGLVPSVNSTMASKKSIQRVLQQLRDDGYLLAEGEASSGIDLDGQSQEGVSRYGLRRLLIKLADASAGGAR